MKNCTNCSHAIFDELWGERKCKKYEHRIYDIDRYIDCQGHENKHASSKNAGGETENA